MSLQQLFKHFNVNRCRDFEQLRMLLNGMEGFLVFVFPVWRPWDWRISFCKACGLARPRTHLGENKPTPILRSELRVPPFSFFPLYPHLKPPSPTHAATHLFKLCWGQAMTMWLPLHCEQMCLYLHFPAAEGQTPEFHRRHASELLARSAPFFLG